MELEHTSSQFYVPQTVRQGKAIYYTEDLGVLFTTCYADNVKTSIIRHIQNHVTVISWLSKSIIYLTVVLSIFTDSPLNNRP